MQTKLLNIKGFFATSPDPVGQSSNAKNSDLHVPLNKLCVLLGPPSPAKSKLVAHVFRSGSFDSHSPRSSFTKTSLVRSISSDSHERVSGLPPVVLFSPQRVPRESDLRMGSLLELTEPLQRIFEVYAKKVCGQCGNEVGDSSATAIANRVLRKYFGDSEKLAKDAKIGAKIIATSEFYLHESKVNWSKFHVLNGFTRFLVSDLSGDEMIKVASPEGEKDSDLKTTLTPLFDAITGGATRTSVKANKSSKADLRVIIDSIDVDSCTHERLAEAIESAQKIGPLSSVLLIQKEKSGQQKAEKKHKVDKWKVQTLERFGNAFNSQFWCNSCENFYDEDTHLQKTVQRYEQSQVEAFDVSDLKSWAKSLSSEEESKFPAVSGDIDLFIKAADALTVLGLDRIKLSSRLSEMSFGERLKAQLSAFALRPLAQVLILMDGFENYFHPQDLNEIRHSLANLVTSSECTVLATEINPENVAPADYVLEVNSNNDQIVFQGPFAEWKALWKALQPVRDPHLAVSSKTTSSSKKSLRISKSQSSQKLDIEMPLQSLVCLTGRIGSGKTFVLRDILGNVDSKLKNKLPKGVSLHGVDPKTRPLYLSCLEDLSDSADFLSDTISELLALDLAIGKIFEAQKEARKHGLDAQAFTLRTGGGRCAGCRGFGLREVDYGVLGKSVETCRDCLGNCFRSDVLSVTFAQLNIQQLLSLSLRRITELLPQIPEIVSAFRVASELGIQDLQLGLRGSELSRQDLTRVQILKFLLRKRNVETSLLLLDEPFAGICEEEIKIVALRLATEAKKCAGVIFSSNSRIAIQQAEFVISL